MAKTYIFSVKHRNAHIGVQAAAGNMTTASLVIGVEIGRREGVYSVERHFLSVDKNDVFDTATTDGGISDWHAPTPS